MIQFQKGSSRNTQCYELRIGPHWFGISYQTIIAYRGHAGLTGEWQACRLHNSWGPTTGRHMRDLNCHQYREVDDEEMADLIRRALMLVGTNILRDRFKLPHMTAEEARDA